MPIYDVFWTKELLEAIRKVEVTESGEATFLTLELGLSLLNLMPQSPKEIALLEQERRLRKKTQATLTYIDAKKAQKAPRLPPCRHEPTMMLLTTYSCFLDMLFGQANAHRAGLIEVRQALMGLQSVARRLPTIFYAKIVWAVLDDNVRHFNKCLSPADF